MDSAFVVVGRHCSLKGWKIAFAWAGPQNATVGGSWGGECVYSKSLFLHTLQYRNAWSKDLAGRALLFDGGSVMCHWGALRRDAV